jgi:tRNA-dihydrouridine synthase B
VRSARKHIGWAVRGLPGGAAFRDRMNRLDDCQAQVRAFDDYFDQLAQTHPALPQAHPAAANEGTLSLAA